MTFGKRLRREREWNGLSQDCISGLCGISRQTWGLYEKDQREPRAGHLIVIADRLGISLDYLLCRTDERINLNV